MVSVERVTDSSIILVMVVLSSVGGAGGGALIYSYQRGRERDRER